MRRLPLFILVGSIVALGVTWVGGVRHDYIYYLEQWQLVLSGQDPWSTNNAYGPLHNAFALLVTLHPLAPKLAQAVLLLVANAALLPRLRDPATYVVAFAANALIWIAVFWFGNNDGLVAALVILGVLARLGGRPLLAGCLLGLAALDKYYPALLIPFFALDDGRLNGKVILAGICTMLAGIGIGTLIWGRALLEAITFGASRDATVLSIFRAIAVIGRQSGWGDAADLLVRFNSLLVVATWAGSLWLAARRKDSWLVASCWGLFAVLLAYKVGHPQFWVTWLALLACLSCSDDAQAAGLARLSWPFAILLSLFQLGFVLIQPEYFRGPNEWVKDYAGLVAFPLGALQLWLFLKPASRPAP